MILALLDVVSLSRLSLGPVSLQVEAGECVSIAGRSGTGKTLLLRAIADLDPHEGEVFLDGASVASISPPQWRSQVGLLPAESAWWQVRVGDHFKEPNREWLDDLGFTEEILAAPVERLSSGERQRLALLRLLANAPRVLLLDEPTANLDVLNVRRMETLITAYRQSTDAAVLWVTHDPMQATRISGRHFRIEDGDLHEARLEQTG
jgi:ABC-type iron transport system FetAB ATPase subunit